MLVIVRGALPPLLNVIVWLALLLPTMTLPKLKLAGDAKTCGDCSITEIVLEPGAATARSRLPSPLKSPITMAAGQRAVT